MKILILGSSGMLGNTLLRFFEQFGNFDVFGTVRDSSSSKLFNSRIRPRLITGVDVENFDVLLKVFSQIKPDIVINCVGLVKQLSAADHPLSSIPINSLLPHRLAHLCATSSARLIHMSTDCVFSGSKGMYTELDIPDATDLYGRSKLLGEVDYPNAITLRTSIIGHEMVGSRSLIGWFLNQDGRHVNGFNRAIFSGLPTIELAKVIRDFVIPRPDLRGVYHVSAEPISKYDLLNLVAHVYNVKVDIVKDDGFVIDRSLNSDRFRGVTGFFPACWDQLIKNMSEFH